MCRLRNGAPLTAGPIGDYRGTMNKERTVERVITAHKQLEGGGFEVRRPLPTAGVEHIDPFLLLDELGPVEYGPGEAIGAPDHPHRGFETVTYILEGAVEHEDSAGHRGRIGAGRRPVDDRRRRHRPLGGAVTRRPRQGRARARLPDLGEPAGEAQDDASRAIRKCRRRESRARRLRTVVRAA